MKNNSMECYFIVVLFNSSPNISSGGSSRIFISTESSQRLQNIFPCKLFGSSVGGWSAREWNFTGKLEIFHRGKFSEEKQKMLENFAIARKMVLVFTQHRCSLCGWRWKKNLVKF